MLGSAGSVGAIVSLKERNDYCIVWGMCRSYGLQVLKGGVIDAQFGESVAATVSLKIRAIAAQCGWCFL